MTPAATASANTNIALIKYWGKADESLTIPTASSLSLTLGATRTTTTVSFDGGADGADAVTINGAAPGGAARPDAREDGVDRARLERHPSLGPSPISRRPRPRRPDGHGGRGRRRPGRGHGRARFDPRARDRGRIRTTPRRAASARRNSSEDPPGRAAEHHDAENIKAPMGGHRAGSRPGSEERR